MSNIDPIYKERGKTDFTIYHCDDDHILMIKKAGYAYTEIYYVIMEDAYGTPTAEIMTKEAVFAKYKIKL